MAGSNRVYKNHVYVFCMTLLRPGLRTPSLKADPLTLSYPVANIPLRRHFDTRNRFSASCPLMLCFCRVSVGFFSVPVLTIAPSLNHPNLIVHPPPDSYLFLTDLLTFLLTNAKINISAVDLYFTDSTFVRTDFSS